MKIQGKYTQLFMCAFALLFGTTNVFSYDQFNVKLSVTVTDNAVLQKRNAACTIDSVPASRADLPLCAHETTVGSKDVLLFYRSKKYPGFSDIGSGLRLSIEGLNFRSLREGTHKFRLPNKRLKTAFTSCNAFGCTPIENLTGNITILKDDVRSIILVDARGSGTPRFGDGSVKGSNMVFVMFETFFRQTADVKETR
jgi:hypothetical protein